MDSGELVKMDLTADGDDENDMMTLVSKHDLEPDAGVFTIPVKAAKMSKTINDFIADNADSRYFVCNSRTGVRKATLAKVVEFCTHHNENPGLYCDLSELTKQQQQKQKNDIQHNTNKDEEVEIISNKIPHRDLLEWDQKFFNSLDKADLFRLINAADYLDIPLLLELSCRTVASMIKGKKAEQLAEEFKVPDGIVP
jgi:S-phase kinase-associated protein 1